MIRLHDVEGAQERLRGVTLRTPLVPCPGGARDRALYFKPESLQPTGALSCARVQQISPALEERGRGAGPLSGNTPCRGYGPAP